MGQILHKRARTTEEIRREIKNSKETLDTLATKYNINKNTVLKWKHRDSTADKKMGNWRANSVLTKEEEYLIQETRKKTWEPLDDLYVLLKLKIPKLSRSNLHRCLKSYWISRIPKHISHPNTYNEDWTKKKNVKWQWKFKIYEAWYVHIDITDFWLGKIKYSIFVAIDRITKLTFTKIYNNKRMESATEFLEDVFWYFPYKIHRVLTDNWLQFTYNALSKNKKPFIENKKIKEIKNENWDSILSKNWSTLTEEVIIKIAKRHPFTQLLLSKWIKHKTTKFFSPQTNWQVEKMNDIIKSATLKFFFYNSIEEFKENLEHFMNYYNFKRKQKWLKYKTPYEKVIDVWKNTPKIFKKNPEHYCVGLNKYLL